LLYGGGIIYNTEEYLHHFRTNSEHDFSFSELVSLSSEKIIEISYRFEELFIEEITAHYYFHLYYDYGFDTRINKPTNYRNSSHINQESKFPRLLPKNCLNLIVQKDKEKPLISECITAGGEILVICKVKSMRF
jgi:hypothetical protein